MPNSTDTLDLFLRKSGDALACFSGTRLGCRMGWIALGRGLGQSAFNRVIGRHMGDRFAFTGISCFDVIGESGAGLTASHHTAAGRVNGHGHNAAKRSHKERNSGLTIICHVRYCRGTRSARIEQK